jgi:hypothetical protein
MYPITQSAHLRNPIGAFIMLKAIVNSHVISTAQLGLDKLRAIDPNLDLGNGLTLQSLDLTVQEARNAIAQYNTAATELAKMNRIRQDQEKALRTSIKRMVMGVGVKYGETSSEYETVQKLWKLTQRSSSAATDAPAEVAPNVPVVPNAPVAPNAPATID